MKLKRVRQALKITLTMRNNRSFTIILEGSRGIFMGDIQSPHTKTPHLVLGTVVQCGGVLIAATPQCFCATVALLC